MKNLSNNYRKMFFAFLIVTGFLGVTGLNANNINPSVSASNINLFDCPTCASESIRTEGVNEIESWMTSDNYWGSFNATETAEPESTVDIENWMVSNDFWGTINVSEVLELDSQNNIENWMSSNSYWKADNLEITAEELVTETPLNVERWMSDATLWK
jgi:hypothetical protein